MVWAGVRSTFKPRQIHTTFPGAPGVPGGPRNPMGPCRGEKAFEVLPQKHTPRGKLQPSLKLLARKSLKFWRLGFFLLSPSRVGIETIPATQLPGLTSADPQPSMEPAALTRSPGGPSGPGSPCNPLGP